MFWARSIRTPQSSGGRRFKKYGEFCHKFKGITKKAKKIKSSGDLLIFCEGGLVRANESICLLHNQDVYRQTKMMRSVLFRL